MKTALKQEEQADRAFAEAERLIAEAVREKMETLSLAALGLTQLPESIGKLTGLQRLYIQNNNLACLRASVDLISYRDCASTTTN